MDATTCFDISFCLTAQLATWSQYNGRRLLRRIVLLGLKDALNQRNDEGCCLPRSCARSSNHVFPFQSQGDDGGLHLRWDAPIQVTNSLERQTESNFCSK